jgi:hypothetical protein
VNTPSPYHQARLKARERVGALGLDAAYDMGQAIDAWHQELGRAVTASRDPARALQIMRSRKVLEQAAERLDAALQKAVNEGRRVSFEEVQSVWQHATQMVAETEGVPGALLGAIRAPGVTLAGAYGALDGVAEGYRTLISGYVSTAAQDVENIIQGALLQGMGTDKLARALRPYLKGAEPFYSAAKRAGVPANFDFRRLQDPSLREAARRLKYNAERIAYTEIHNARAEAEIQHFALDPLVEAVKWELAPNRGRARVPDVCDGLAHNNWYGLGVGVFPLDSVPLPPHPFDRCERVPVLRDVADADKPKPSPDRVLEPSGAYLPFGGGNLTQAREAAVKRELGQVLTESHRSQRVGRQVGQLLQVGQTQAFMHQVAVVREDAPIGQFTSLEEAELVMAKKYPHITWDFKGTHLDVMNPSLQQLDKLLQEWPEVGERLRYVGTYEGKRPSWIPKDGHDWGKSQNVFAHANLSGYSGAGGSPGNGGKYLGINPRYYGDPERFAEGLKASTAAYVRAGKKVATRWHPEGTEGFESVITHEFGHLWDSWLRFGQDMGAFVPYTRTSGFGLVKDTWRMIVAQVRGSSAVSEYAMTNEYEKVAESFTALYHSPAGSGARKAQITRSMDAFARLLKKGRRLNYGYTPDVPYGPERDAVIAELEKLATSLGLKHV